MLELEVIDDAAVAAVALDPIRARILAALSTPGSAASVALALKLPRQKVNYHLRALEAHGLLVLAEERRWGGLTERQRRALLKQHPEVVSWSEFFAAQRKHRSAV